MQRIRNHALAALALFLSLTQPAAAQVPCHFGDDGFDVGCCKDAQPNLPDFPEIKIDGVYGCLRNCQLENAFKVEIKLGKPQFVLCDTAVIELSVAPLTPGGPTISGKLNAKYSRTWLTTHSGTIQVWRFLLNGDWDFGPAIGIAGCPVPPHLDPSHAIGSIDYACDPLSPVASAQVVLDLSHLPGCLSHGSLSARPLAGAAAHANRSYHLVAPSNFAFVAGNDLQGPFFEEAVRSSPTGPNFPATYQCLGEAPVREGKLSSVFKNCLCTSLIGGPWVHSDLKGEVDCSGQAAAFESVPNFDPVVPTGLVGLRLGSWSGPAWPGDLELTVYAGYLRYEDPCVPLSDLDPDRVFGVGTYGVEGYLFGPSFSPEKAFVDLQDSLVETSTFPVALKKIFGAPAWGSLVWNLNPRP